MVIKLVYIEQKKTWTSSSTFYRYRQTPNYHIRVKAHAEA